MRLRLVNVETVKKKLKILKIVEAVLMTVKLSAGCIAKHLHHIITMSLMKNKFPSIWKYTKIIPLNKKLSILECKNYCSLAIMFPLSKILEKVVYLQIDEHFIHVFDL